MIKKFFRGRRNKNNCVVAIIGILVCFVTVGFAAMATSLSINGSATVTSATWNVKFANIRVFGGSVIPTTEATISDDTKISFDLTLNQPNEYYKFLVDVVNEGTIDAMIKTITMPSVSGNLEFSATYKDGTAISQNDSLKHGETKTLLVTLKYKDSMAAETTTQEVTYALNYGQADDFVKELATEYTVADLINLSNGASTAAYASNSVQAEMYAFAHTATSQLGANVDYRYIGKSPQNYIKFNEDEMWRIIGVFQNNDGKNRLKIIREDLIENKNIEWDGKNTIGSSTTGNGSNLWTDAQLMYYLNPDDITANATAKGYIIDENYVKCGSNIIYEKGKLPADIAAGAASYPGAASSWRVSSDALTKVDFVKYYLGGSVYNSTTGYGTGEEIYNWERGNKGRNNSTSEADLSWTGRVALMYPSDYVYTFAKGIDDTCFTNGNKCNSSGGGVPENSWLYKSAYSQWTLVPRSGNASYAFYVFSNGFVDGNIVTDIRGVRPVVYLKSDIKLSGSGTSTDPYVIK